MKHKLCIKVILLCFVVCIFTGCRNQNAGQETTASVETQQDITTAGTIAERATENTSEMVAEATNEATTEEKQKTIFDSFNLVDYKVLSGFIAQQCAVVNGCDLLDIDGDQKEELLMTSELDSDNLPAYYLFDDTDHPSLVVYVPTGAAESGCYYVDYSKQKLYYNEQYSTVVFATDNYYIWDGEWKDLGYFNMEATIDDETCGYEIYVWEEDDLSPDVWNQMKNETLGKCEEIRDQYQQIQCISVENGDYESICKDYESHLKDVGIASTVFHSDLDGDGVVEACFVSDNYRKPWWSSKDNINEIDKSYLKRCISIVVVDQVEETITFDVYYLPKEDRMYQPDIQGSNFIFSSKKDSDKTKTYHFNSSTHEFEKR